MSNTYVPNTPPDSQPSATSRKRKRTEDDPPRSPASGVSHVTVSDTGSPPPVDRYTAPRICPPGCRHHLQGIPPTLKSYRKEVGMNRLMRLGPPAVPFDGFDVTKEAQTPSARAINDYLAPVAVTVSNGVGQEGTSLHYLSGEYSPKHHSPTYNTRGYTRGYARASGLRFGEVVRVNSRTPGVNGSSGNVYEGNEMEIDADNEVHDSMHDRESSPTRVRLEGATEKEMTDEGDDYEEAVEHEKNGEEADWPEEVWAQDEGGEGDDDGEEDNEHHETDGGDTNDEREPGEKDGKSREDGKDPNEAEEDDEDSMDIDEGGPPAVATLGDAEANEKDTFKADKVLEEKIVKGRRKYLVSWKPCIVPKSQMNKSKKMAFMGEGWFAYQRFEITISNTHRVYWKPTWESDITSGLLGEWRRKKRDRARKAAEGA